MLCTVAVEMRHDMPHNDVSKAFHAVAEGLVPLYADFDGGHQTNTELEDRMEKQAELIGTQKVDDLGRVVIPKQLRQEGWGTGSTVSFCHVDGRTILVKLVETYQGPSCAFCNKKEKAVTLNAIDICADCLSKIKGL